MTYRYMTREEMVGVTTSLVREGHDDYRVIHSHPLARALWVLIADAHAELVRMQPGGPTAARMVEIRDELAALSRRLGEVLRGIYHGLLAQEHLARDEDVRAEAHRLRTKMFPDKLMATRKSYRGHVGQALLLDSGLTDEERDALRRLSTLDGGSFADALDEWFEIAGRMGDLEDERSGDARRVITAADVSAARNGWIRAVRAFITTLRMRADVPEELVAILDRIERVGERAARRRARKRTEETDTAGLPEPERPPAGEASRRSAGPGTGPTAGPRAPDPGSMADAAGDGPPQPSAVT